MTKLCWSSFWSHQHLLALFWAKVERRSFASRASHAQISSCQKLAISFQVYWRIFLKEKFGCTFLLQLTVGSREVIGIAKNLTEDVISLPSGLRELVDPERWGPVNDFHWSSSSFGVVFSALTLLVGDRKVIQPVKKSAAVIPKASLSRTQQQ